MKFSAIALFSLLSSANAVGLGSIRGEEQDQQIDFACTLKGGCEYFVVTYCIVGIVNCRCSCDSLENEVWVSAACRIK